MNICIYCIFIIYNYSIYIYISGERSSHNGMKSQTFWGWWIVTPVESAKMILFNPGDSNHGQKSPNKPFPVSQEQNQTLLDFIYATLEPTNIHKLNLRFCFTSLFGSDVIVFLWCMCVCESFQKLHSFTSACIWLCIRACVTPKTTTFSGTEIHVVRGPNFPYEFGVCGIHPSLARHISIYIFILN